MTGCLRNASLTHFGYSHPIRSWHALVSSSLPCTYTSTVQSAFCVSKRVSLSVILDFVPCGKILSISPDDRAHIKYFNASGHWYSHHQHQSVNDSLRASSEIRLFLILPAREYINSLVSARLSSLPPCLPQPPEPYPLPTRAKPMRPSTSSMVISSQERRLSSLCMAVLACLTTSKSSLSIDTTCVDLIETVCSRTRHSTNKLGM